MTLVATPNPGYGFVNWTENGVPASPSAVYNFIATTNRTLVANFTAAYLINVGVSPVSAGSASGSGSFNSISTVTVIASPVPGFSFVDWTEFGTEVSAPARSMRSHRILDDSRSER